MKTPPLLNVELAPNCFSYLHRVAFPDCDPAGIVYYPRYFDMLQRCKEAWFDAVVGQDYAHWIDARQTGFPTRALHAEFFSPSRLSECLWVHLSIAQLGSSSLKVAYAITVVQAGRSAYTTLQDATAGVLRMRCEATLIAASHTPLKAIALPSDLRLRCEAFMHGTINFD